MLIQWIINLLFGLNGNLQSILKITEKLTCLGVMVDNYTCNLRSFMFVIELVGGNKAFYFISNETR